MMGYGYADGGDWMWVYGTLMIIGVLLLIRATEWAATALTARHHHEPAGPWPADTGGRARTRQLLDERHARGEMNSEDYTERLHTLDL